MTDAKPEDLVRCYRADCIEQHPIAKDADEIWGETVTCPTCRHYLHLPPLPLKG